MAKPKIYGVRRFATGRDDRQNFEMYVIATGECASFPGTKTALEAYARRRNRFEWHGDNAEAGEA